jgi:hypothetical protein
MVTVDDRPEGLLAINSLKDINELPSACAESSIDFNLIKNHFEEEAFVELTKRIQMKKIQPWSCGQCFNEIEEVRSIGCDSCLNWFHYSCGGVKSDPKTKYWFCKKCKV